MTTTIFYEIFDGHGWIGKDSNYHFQTADEALAIAKEFKNNPRSHNPKMSAENVKSWKRKNYTIQKKTIINEDIETI